MPKTEQQLTRLKEIRKNEITSSALKIFCEKGYAYTTVNDIVKKAKCSHGLFYHYFKSKKDIFEEVHRSKNDDFNVFITALFNKDGKYTDKLRELTEYTFNNIKKDEIFAYRYYFFISTVFLKAESNEKPPKGKEPPHVKMNAFFQEGIKSGEFKNKYPASDCTRLYHSILQGATLNFILCPKEFKNSFTFPNVEHILDIFRKEDVNE